MVALGQGATLLRGYGADIASAFARSREVDYARIYWQCSCWWTIGGENYAPAALVDASFPQAAVYSGMLTGDFDALR
jgi:hypothetical protein